MSETINPITGLPVNATPTSNTTATAPEINPITGRAASRRTQEAGIGNRVGRVTNTFDGMTYKDYNSFQSYGVNVTEGIDHYEARAQNQSTFEKWGHGLAKAGVTAIGALGENTIGLFVGLGSVATGGSFYDHALGRGIDGMNERMAEWMPNYYTRAEEQAGAFSATNLLSANFWADKVANGVGYVLGSIATDVALAYASGGQSLSLTAARYAAKFGKAKKALDVAQKTKALSNVYKTTKAASKGKQIGGLLGKTGQVTKTGGWKKAYARAENGLISAIGESNVEARQAKHETMTNLTEAWLHENPGKTEADIPQDVMERFEDQATAAGNTVFAINMPVVAGTNIVTVGRMLGPGYRKSVSKLAKGGDDAMFNVRKGLRPENAGKWVDAGTDANWTKRTFTNISRRAGDQIKSTVSETLQEGTQFFASNFAQEYYGEKYSSNKGMGGLISAAEHGLRQTFGTKEGLESMLIGGIVGGGTVGVTNTVRRLKGKQTAYGQKMANTQQALDLLNDGVLNKPIENVRNAEENAQLIEAMDDALALSQDPNAPISLRRKAHKRFKDAQYALIAQNAQYFVAMGKTDLVMEQLEDAKDLTEEEFKKAFGYDVNQPLPEGGQAAIVDKLKSKFKKHQKTLERIDAAVPAMERTTGLPRKLMSQEEIEQENLEVEANNFYRRALYKRATSIDGHTERLDNIKAEMQQLSNGALNETAMEEYEYSPNIEFTFEDEDGVVVDGRAVENGQVLGGKVLEEINRVAEEIKNPLDKQEFLAAAQDYTHLLAERQAIINSYEALTGTEGPATAEFLHARQQAMEGHAAKVKLQEEVEDVINNAVVPEDLRNLPPNATQEQVSRAEQKRQELLKEINDEAAQKYSGLTAEELETELHKAQEAGETDARKLAVLEYALNAVRAKDKKAAEEAQRNGQEGQTPEEVFGGQSDQTPGADEAAADRQERDEDLLDSDNYPDPEAEEETQPADEELLVDEETGEILDTTPIEQLKAEEQDTGRSRLMQAGENAKIDRDTDPNSPFKGMTDEEIDAEFEQGLNNLNTLLQALRRAGASNAKITKAITARISNHPILRMARGGFQQFEDSVAKGLDTFRGSAEIHAEIATLQTQEETPIPAGVLDIGIVDIQDFAEDVVDGPDGQPRRRVIVDENGRPLMTPNQFKAANGIDGREVLKTPTEGETISFELLADKGDWKLSPILVKRGDVTIGILKPGKETASLDRQVIYDNLKAGRVVTATSKFSGRFHLANTVQQDPDGNFTETFYSVASVFGPDVAFGVVKMPGKTPEVVPGNGKLATNEMTTRSLELGQRDASEAGQLYIYHKSPITGGMEPLKIHTKYLTTEEVDLAMKLLKEGNLVDLEKFVGLNAVPYTSIVEAGDRSADPTNFLFAINPGASGEALVYFSPKANSLVKVYVNQLTGSASIMPVKKVVPPSGTMTEDAGDRFKEVGTHQMTGVDILNEIGAILPNKRHQVLASLINSPDATFKHPFTGEDVNYREYIMGGADPKVLTDFSPQVGVYHGVGLEFSELNIGGIAKEDQPKNVEIPTAPTPKPAPKPTVSNPLPKKAGSNPRGGKKLRRRGTKTTSKAVPVTKPAAPAKPTVTYTPKGKKQQTYTIDGTKILNEKGKEVFKKDSANRRKIFANLAVLQGRAEVIEHDGAKYVVNNKGEIMSTKTGKIMAWGANHGSRRAILAKSTVYESTAKDLFSDIGEETNKKCNN